MNRIFPVCRCHCFSNKFVACGVCSSMQDQAVYIEVPDLQDYGQNCGLISLKNETKALECYEEAGFTRGCAAAWLYNTINTRKKCLPICINYVNKAPNEDQAFCPLNPCIACDEIESGPVFKRAAGRTRRASGLLSYIVRNCSELAYGAVPINPCPNGTTANMTMDDDEDDVSSGPFGGLGGSGFSISAADLPINNNNNNDPTRSTSTLPDDLTPSNDAFSDSSSGWSRVKLLKLLTVVTIAVCCALTPI
jgi:hypothetical protein